MLLALKLFAPLLLGLAVHGLCIRTGALRGLTRPIDAGRTFRGRRLFGENKTYRGVLAVALGTGLGYALQSAFAGLPRPGASPGQPRWLRPRHAHVVALRA